MKKYILGSLIVGTLLFTGCARPIMGGVNETKEEVYSEMYIKRDSFNNSAWVYTNEYFLDSEEGIGLANRYLSNYRVFLKDDKVSFVQLYMVDHSKTWNFPNRVLGEDGFNFNFKVLDNKVSNTKFLGVGVTEVFVINVPIDKLNLISNKDYKIKIYNKKSSDNVITIPKTLSGAVNDYVIKNK